MIIVKYIFPRTLCASDYTIGNAVVGNIFITNNTTQEISDLSVRGKCNPEVLDFPILSIKTVPHNETIELNPEITLSSQYYKLKSDIQVELSISVYCKEDLEYHFHETIHVFPYNYWDGLVFKKLASFMFMDDTAISPVLHRVEYYMRLFSGNDKMSGYLYDIPTRPRYTMQAIANSIAECSLNKVPSNNLIAPKYILPPDEIMRQRKCNELDMALFISSCLFVTKLNPIICFAKDEILVGCWLKKLKLAEPILYQKEEIKDFVETCNDDIAWLHLNNVFCDCDYDISYGFVFADKYLQRHLKEIKTIIDIRNIRSNGVYTVKKNAEHPIKLTDYQESSISLTEQSKIDYALIINKYFEERRKYVSAIRSNTIYIEILSELYNRWCTETNSYKKPQVAEYLSNYSFHSNILTQEENKALYEMRNKVILRAINHLAHPNIKYGKFVREVINVKKNDSILIINDETGGLTSMISGYCKWLTVVSENILTNIVYSIWNVFNQFDKFTIRSDMPSRMECKFDKILIVVSRNADPDSAYELLDSTLQINCNETIISFSETLFNKLWRKTRDNKKILDKYINYISNIYYIPDGIAETNEARYLIKVNKNVQNFIEMTDTSLIPRSSFLDSFNMVKKEEKKFNEQIVTKQAYVKSPEWSIKISEDKNPYNPKTWTIPYDKYCYIDDFLFILSSNKEKHSFINNNFISVDKLLSMCKKTDSFYHYDASNYESESISEYENIGSQYYRLSKPVIILYPLGTDAYIWESLGRLASNKHKFNYKIIIIDDISEKKTLILKDDNNILIFEPKQSKDIVAISRFMRIDLFFAKQMDIYKKFYTNKQLKMYLHRIIVPLSLLEHQDIKSDNDVLINHYRQRPGKNTMPISKMIENVLEVATALGIANYEQKIIYITGLADLLVRLEYVKPRDGWEFISKKWKEQSDYSREKLKKEMYEYKLKWEKFDKVFLNKKGKPIAKETLGSSFYQKNRIERAAGNIIIEVMERY